MPFQKGKSGNAKGRPKGMTLTAFIRAELESSKGAKAQELARSMIQQALDGHGVAMTQILNRIDGPVSQDITSGGEPIKTYVVISPSELGSETVPPSG